MITKKFVNVTSYKLQVIRSKGFTLLELLVSIGIMGLLVGFSSLAYLNIQKNSDLSNQTSQLVNTIKQVQSLAMSGQTGTSYAPINLAELKKTRFWISSAYAMVLGDPPPSGSQLDMGIHFETNSYSIFYDNAYNPLDSKNITTNLSSQVTIDINLPSSELIFMALTGELQAYNSDLNTITISQSGGQSHTLTVNKLGIVNID